MSTVNDNNVRVRGAWASVFHVRFDVELGDRLYDVHVDALDDSFDVEVFDQSFGDPVDLDDFIAAFGFSQVYEFAEAFVEGFSFDGPQEFSLAVAAEVK
jgi:glycosyltransferase A (GT-A) superfamily protein (DUF2064 family)